MTQDDALKAAPIRRIQSFDGMAVTAQVWDESHAYHQLYRRLHARPGHGTGILTGLEVIGPDPLLGAAGDDVDDLLPVRVPVERVTMVRRHVGAHQQQLVGGDDIGAAEPLVVCPGIGFTQGVGEQDEAAVGGVHGRGGGTGRELSAKTRRRKGRREE